MRRCYSLLICLLPVLGIPAAAWATSETGTFASERTAPGSLASETKSSLSQSRSTTKTATAFDREKGSASFDRKGKTNAITSTATTPDAKTPAPRTSTRVDPLASAPSTLKAGEKSAIDSTPPPPPESSDAAAERVAPTAQ